MLNIVVALIVVALPLALRTKHAATLPLVLVILACFTTNVSREILPPRYRILLACSVCIFLIAGLELDRKSWRPIVMVTLSLVGLAGFLVFSFNLLELEPGDSDRALRFVLLFPLGLALGTALTKSDNFQTFSKIFTMVALVSAIVAIGEVLVGARFLQSSDFSSELSRGGRLRSSAFVEQPLVLAALLIVAMVILHFNPDTSHRRKLIEFGILAGGVWATGSRGALIIAIVLTFAIFALIRIPHLSRASGFAAWVTAVSGAALAYVLTTGASASAVGSRNADEASLEYRYAIYSFIPKSLQISPLGWGLEGLPNGVFLIRSNFGVLDLANTIDSEYVRLVIDFGWLGVLIFATICWMLFTFNRIRTTAGLSVLFLLLCGTFVAIHSWAGLGFIACVLIGSSVGSKDCALPCHAYWATRSIRTGGPPSSSPRSKTDVVDAKPGA